ncbi:TetR/AcrR family transcriptional regulator [Ciceribacter ferrooxidans]|uniref:TetR/AcrR family transcriptional regulator n=1 Tax=Ciceribacter ferrooxidans TaxID=2509717 RepID=A0A4Q2T9G1_9HYPH|nr:TetR/AcrR family transcriptional regulator [Ciceribacter ferrooxidans]RYC15701.1 TetR/AcrR family transcriptional regulator [Ciceribacter ferrooxidans]
MARQAGSTGEKTAAAIRRQSLRLFAQHGYDAVSMRMIADAVGVQPGALYQYFPTKQQILVTLMREHMEELLASLKEQGIGNEPPEAALEHFARFHIRYHLTRADEVFISYMELRALEPAGFREIERLRKTYESELKAILVRGSERGLFRIEDSHVCAMAIIAMLTGVNTWYRSGGRLSEKKIEEIYAEMVLRSVGCAH